MKVARRLVPFHPAVRILNHPTSSFPERNAVDLALITEKRSELRCYIAVPDATAAIIDADVETTVDGSCRDVLEPGGVA
jgi:hypothetical protein